MSISFDQKKVQDIFFRYALLVVIAFPSLALFYELFTPITLLPVFYILNIFYPQATISGSTIFIDSAIIEIVDACVAGAAYYLLTILNLATPNIERTKRIAMLVWSYGAFLLLNIARIVILSFMVVRGSIYFDIVHSIFWIALSTVFVVTTWFMLVYVYAIKKIPFFSDIYYFYQHSLFTKITSNKKKK